MTQASQTDEIDASPLINPRRTSILWISVIVVVGLFRLFVTADDEIVPTRFDAAKYAETSIGLFLESSYSTLPTHRPGLALIIWCTSTLGIPYKLFLDLLLFTLAIAAGWTASRISGNQVVGLTMFVAIALDPWFITRSQMLLTEPLTAILMTLLILAMLQMICRSVRQWSLASALLASLVASIYVLVRNEFLLLVFLCGFVFVLVLIRQQSPNDETASIQTSYRHRVFHWKLMLVFLPVISALLATQAFKVYYHKKFGVSALCATEAPGFNALMNALYSVTPDQAMEIAPVTYESLTRVCNESETMALHRDRLLDKNRGAFSIIKNKFDVEGEFGNWLNWHLIDAFRGIGRQTNTEMMKAAEEIRAAQNEKRLPRRFARFPINPMWQSLLSQIPNDFATSLRVGVYPPRLDLSSQFEILHSDNSAELGFFDDSVMRRGGTGVDSQFRLFGTLDTHSNTVFTSAQLLSVSGELIMTIPIRESEAGKPIFSLSIDNIENPQIGSPLFLRLVSSSNPSTVSNQVPISHDSRFTFQEFILAGQDIDEVRERWRLSSNMYAGKSRLRVSIYRWLVDQRWLVLVVLALTAIFAGYRNAYDRTLVRNAKWIAIVAGGFVSVRCLFYCLINAWLQWGVIRYVEPNLYITLMTIVCLLFYLGGLGVRLIRGQPEPGT